MYQPPGFMDPQHPNHVCLLQRPLYGLKQAPRACFQRFADYAIRAGFYHSRCDTSLFIYQQGSQKKYACELLEHANMVNCNPSRTPGNTDSKLGPEGVAIQDPTLYRSLAGGLQYLTFTRPDLSYAVQQICLYMHDPQEPHFASLKRILRYLCNLLRELHSPLSTATLVYCDNVSAVYLSANPVQHQRTKHIEIDIHFVRDVVQTGHIRVLHVPSRYQYADIFTKGLPTALFEDFRYCLKIFAPV
nr:ribonuclease H-like domain-containing protein [Tanacetum cinerariifolium]